MRRVFCLSKLLLKVRCQKEYTSLSTAYASKKGYIYFMKLNKPKKHHFVPECYLRKFIHKNELSVLDISKVKKGYKEYIRKKKPAQVCYEHEYYSISDTLRTDAFGLNNFEELFIESILLRKIEERYNTLFSKITRDTSIALKDAIDWSDFIIQMKIRNPYYQKNIKRNQDKWVEDSMRDIYKQLPQEGRYLNVPEEIKKAMNDSIVDKYKADIDFSKKIQLSTIINRDSDNPLTNERFRQALINCQWYLLIAEKEPYFITSDNPGFSVTDQDNLIYNTRFINHFSFYFPLSPNYCLLINDHNLDNSYKEQHMNKPIIKTTVSPSLIIWVNNKTIQLINKLLIASSDWYLSKVLEANQA